MTTTPQDPTAGEPQDDAPETSATPDGRGAEIGITEGEGSSFEPEEDAEGHS